MRGVKCITALSVVTTFDLPLSRGTAIVQHIRQKVQTKTKTFHFGNH